MSTLKLMRLVEEEIDSVERHIRAIKEAEPAGDGPLSLELDLLYCIQEEYRMMLKTPQMLVFTFRFPLLLRA